MGRTRSRMPPLRVSELSKLTELAWDSWPSVDGIASAVEARPTSEGATLLNKLDDGFVASVFNNVSIEKVASILNSPNFSPDKAKSVLSNANLSADRTQEILYAMVDNDYYDRLLEIMTCDAPDKSITADTTWSDGVNRVRNLSIDSGVTLTLGASPGVIIADTISNSGIIKSGWWKASGGNPGAPPGRGGNGAGGIIIFARTIDVGTVHADGQDGESGSGTAYMSSGTDGGGGLFWEIDGYPAGNGGDGGYFGGKGNKNGGGGGFGGSHAGGDGGSASVVTFSTPEDLLKELFKGVVDWYIQNVLNKAPTTVKAIPELGGSGGGGGEDDDTICDAGGGGGGGGEIIIYGTSVTAGTVTAKGGNGGNGGNEGSFDSGGGGGGGGIIYVFYKSLTDTFTFDVSGGTGGTGDYNGANGSAGSAKTFQV